MEAQNIVVGSREDWGQETPFGISPADRRHHVYVIGQTGVGKTTLLRNMMVQDILAGRGVGFLDPHGDASRELLDYIPPWRSRDVIYFDPADTKRPVAFNLLSPTKQPHLVASGFVGALKNIWKDSWGPRLEYILYATVAALLECEGVSALGIQRMLTDGRYRAWVVRQVKDPVVRVFWLNEFENYSRNFLQEAVAPIQNKVGKLLMSPHIRNAIGQVKCKIDPRFIMDRRRIFIANLSRGRLGDDKAQLLGALLVTHFEQAAMSRADVGEEQRPDFHLFADEFQGFASDSFASILSEARKYRLCLTLSHQYMEQLPLELRHAVFGNVGSMIAFRVGHRDAEVLEAEFGREVRAAQFTRLGRHEVFAKLLVEGQHGEPFLGKTMPTIGRRYSRGREIIRSSRQRYGVKRKRVEGKIERWLN